MKHKKQELQLCVFEASFLTTLHVSFQSLFFSVGFTMAVASSRESNSHAIIHTTAGIGNSTRIICRSQLRLITRIRYQFHCVSIVLVPVILGAVTIIGQNGTVKTNKLTPPNVNSNSNTKTPTTRDTIRHHIETCHILEKER